MTLKGTILTGVFGAMFLFAGVGTAQAHDNNCSDRIRKEEIKLQREVRKHGSFSRQAQNRREKLLRLRQQCGDSFWGFGRDRNDRWGGRDRDRDDRWGRNDRRRDRDDRWERDGRWEDRDRDNDRRRDNNWYWDGRQWRRR